MLPPDLWLDVQAFLLVPEDADALHTLVAEVKQVYKRSAKLHQNSKKIAVVNQLTALQYRFRLQSLHAILFNGMRDITRLSMTCSHFDSGLSIHMLQTIRIARALVKVIDRNLRAVEEIEADPNAPPIVRLLIRLQ
jgi:hypothetical protein